MREQALWSAVLDQAVSDAVTRPKVPKLSDSFLEKTARSLFVAAHPELVGSRTAAKKEIIADGVAVMLRDGAAMVRAEANRRAINTVTRVRSEARSWLVGDSADFRLVCTLALLDPDAVHDRMIRLQARHWQLADSLPSKKYQKKMNEEMI